MHVDDKILEEIVADLVGKRSTGGIVLGKDG